MSRGENIRAAGIRKFGSEEAWRAEMRARASLGGKTERDTPRGFAADPEFASKAGRIGGLVSRRPSKRNREEHAGGAAQDE